jgi:hypothetical protein
MALQEGVIVPGPLTDEQWQRPHCLGMSAVPGQDHRLDRLPRPLQPQAAQVLVGPLALCATPQQGARDRVLLPQFLNQIMQGLRR